MEKIPKREKKNQKLKKNLYSFEETLLCHHFQRELLLNCDILVKYNCHSDVSDVQVLSHCSSDLRLLYVDNVGTIRHDGYFHCTSNGMDKCLYCRQQYDGKTEQLWSTTSSSNAFVHSRKFVCLISSTREILIDDDQIQ